MKRLSSSLLAETIVSRRKELKMTQKQLAEAVGMNRSLLSALEREKFKPSIDQLEALASVLDFELTDLFVDQQTEPSTLEGSHRIAVAGTGYVGLSLAVLLAQHNYVTAVDIVPEKVEKLNNYISPIQDDYIEKYLEEAKEGKRTLNLKATTDGESAYAEAEFIVVAAPTNYDPKTNYFDCSAVETIIRSVKEAVSGKDPADQPTIVI